MFEGEITDAGVRVLGIPASRCQSHLNQPTEAALRIAFANGAVQQSSAAGGPYAKCTCCDPLLSALLRRALQRRFCSPAVVFDVPQQVPVLVLRQRAANVQ